MPVTDMAMVMATAIKVVTGMGTGTGIKAVMTVMATRATVMDMVTVGGGTVTGGVMESAPAGAGRPTVTFGFVTRRARSQRLTKKLSNAGAP